MQITGFDASPCSVRDAGWFNVTDNQAMETGETFAAGKDYCLSLFLLPPEGKTWAPDAGVRLVLTDGEEIVPVRSFIQMGGDGVAVLIGDFILTAVTEEEAAAREAEQPGTASAEETPAGGGTGEAAPGESASGEIPEEETPAGESGEVSAAAEPSELPEGGSLEGSDGTLLLFLDDGFLAMLRAAIPDAAPADALVGFRELEVPASGGAPRFGVSSPARVPGLGTILAAPAP